MLYGFEGHQSCSSDDLHFHADVLHFHEFQGELAIYLIILNILKLQLLFQLNIHRFKVVARFGLMHVVATNICVWIRTLVLEYIKEVTLYHQKIFNSTFPQSYSPIAGKLFYWKYSVFLNTSFQKAYVYTQ